MRTFIVVIALFALFSAAGCSGTRVVLLPDPDGQVGRVEVTNQAGSATLDQALQGTTIAKPDAAPSGPTLWTESDIQSTFGRALAAQPAVPARFLLYFLSDATTLLGVSEELIPDIMNEIQARHSLDISINGHTDRMGDEAYNVDLSLRRAQAVFDLLVQKGVDPQLMDVSSHGEGDPIIPTADEVSEPRNRRVEVIVR